MLGGRLRNDSACELQGAGAARLQEFKAPKRVPRHGGMQRNAL